MMQAGCWSSYSSSCGTRNEIYPCILIFAPGDKETIAPLGLGSSWFLADIAEEEVQ